MTNWKVHVGLLLVLFAQVAEPAASPKAKAWKKWMVDNGASFDLCRVVRGRCVATENNADYMNTSWDEPMEPIIRIPNPLTLSVRYFSNQDRESLVRDFESADFNLTEPDLLAMFIGSEKGRATSFWEPYFSFVEEEMDFWNAHHLSPAELEALEGTFAMKLVMEERHRLQYIYQVLENIAEENDVEPTVTMEQLTFGRSLLVGHSMLGVGGQRMHVPGLGLLRYSPFPKHARRQPTFKFRKGKAGEPVLVAFDVGSHEDGEEIYQSMMHLSNAEALRDFGMSFAQNPYDYVEIVLGKTRKKRDTQWNKRLAVLRGQGLKRRVRIASSTMPSTALQVCRVFKASEDELEAVIRGELTLDILSDSVEESCLDELQAAVQQLLDEYPHTVQDDKKLLASIGVGDDSDEDNEQEWALDKETTRLRRLVLVRMGEQQVLAGFKHRLQTERVEWRNQAQGRGYVCNAQEDFTEAQQRAQKRVDAKAKAQAEVLAQEELKERTQAEVLAQEELKERTQEEAAERAKEAMALAAKKSEERAEIILLAKKQAGADAEPKQQGGDAGAGSKFHCECAADGVSGGQQTDIKGCDKSPPNTELAGLGSVCFVVDPGRCEESRESGSYPGAQWRFCS
jgi:hypothetical protein